VEQFAPDRFTRAAFKEPVVGNDDGRPAVELQEGFNVQQKVELLVEG